MKYEVNERQRKNIDLDFGSEYQKQNKWRKISQKIIKCVIKTTELKKQKRNMKAIDSKQWHQNVIILAKRKSYK